MNIKDIGQAIAYRSLVAGDQVLRVVIGKPEVFHSEGEYFCPYSIELKDEKRFDYAVGIDSIQALQLAMKKIGADLAHLSREKSVPISWFPDMPGETGFPR